MELLIPFAFLACFFAGLRYPHLAIAAFAALLPLEARLPASIADLSLVGATPVAALGAALLIGAAVHLVTSGRLTVGSVVRSVPQMAGLLFIVWIAITAPGPAFGLEGGRNWVMSLLQLWALFVVAGLALDTREKHYTVMTAFAAACLMSAAIAIVTGNIDDARDVRSAGLAAGPNAAARYFVVGMVFLFFLQGKAANGWLRLGSAVGAAGLIVGVLYTQSRTGLLLGVAAMVLSPVVAARQRVSQGLLNIAAFAVVGLMLLPEGFVDSVTLWFFPESVSTSASAELEGFTANMRWHLWQAGVEMWQAHPISGVGIDGFGRNALEYVDIPLSVKNPYPNLTSHSMYVSLLSETGAVGFALFLTMALTSLRAAWRSHRADASTGVGAAWLVGLLVLLIGAQLKNDIGEKMLWLTMGVAASLAPVATAIPIVRRGLIRRPANVRGAGAIAPRPATPARPGVQQHGPGRI